MNIMLKEPDFPQQPQSAASKEDVYHSQVLVVKAINKNTQQYQANQETLNDIKTIVEDNRDRNFQWRTFIFLSGVMGLVCMLLAALGQPWRHAIMIWFTIISIFFVVMVISHYVTHDTWPCWKQGKCGRNWAARVKRAQQVTRVATLGQTTTLLSAGGVTVAMASAYGIDEVINVVYFACNGIIFVCTVLCVLSDCGWNPGLRWFRCCDRACDACEKQCGCRAYVSKKWGICKPTKTTCFCCEKSMQPEIDKMQKKNENNVKTDENKDNSKKTMQHSKLIDQEDLHTRLPTDGGGPTYAASSILDESVQSNKQPILEMTTTTSQL